MAFPVYAYPDVFPNDTRNTNKITWNSAGCVLTMDDNNDDYFSWNCLKIDEENYDDPVPEKTSRKRKSPAEHLCSENGGSKVRNLGDNVTSKNPMSLQEEMTRSLQAKKATIQNNSSKMPNWQVEDITDLNGDIDSSLSLGSDLGNNSYNVGEAILSISGLTVFKQEAPSPTNDVLGAQLNRHNRQSPNHAQKSSLNNSNNVSTSVADNTTINNTISQLFGQSSYSGLQNALDGANLMQHSSTHESNYNVSSTSYTSFPDDGRFQYVLAAATSIATKLNEDTLTYLNQGQSYEIKLKKLGELSMYKGKTLKSVIRICFHERRLQYMEKEQMTSWQRARPGDRILEVDVPLSYGAYDIVQPPNALNVVHFSWDPTKEVGVYIKVNCISTEFTPKKHGGEKGVPFRIQVETYHNGENLESSKRLHAAVCQIKVFKLKGADRKHKQDREKIMKRPLSEQEKYQPSYECTVLNDIPNDAVLTSPPVAPIAPIMSLEGGSQNSPCKLSNPLDSGPFSSQNSPASLQEENSESKLIQNNINFSEEQLSPSATPEQTITWLTNNRFERFLQTFANFSGADMLRMCRDDLIQICGHADGIRLYNVLHSKVITPKLKIYVCRDKSSVYNAIFLSAHSSFELMEKLAHLTEISIDRVRDICIEGPHSIQVQVTNDVIKHIKEDSMFLVDIIQENTGSIIFILKPTISSNS